MLLGFWLDWSGRPEHEYWEATPAEAGRAVVAGIRRRARTLHDMTAAARLGQSTEKNIEKFLPPLGGEDDYGLRNPGSNCLSRPDQAI